MQNSAMENSPEQKVRRVVTGHDAKGRSVIVSDTSAMMERPLHEFWMTQETPARTGGAPPLGALPQKLDQMYATVFASIDAAHTRVDTRRHPAMHKTRTLDYGIVLCGRIRLLMDEGEEIELKPFDVVVQRGTNHGWVNQGAEPALMAFVLIDGTE